MNAPRQSITQKQFLDGLAAYAAAQIEVLDRECVGFSTDTKEQAKRVKQAQSDFAYFSRTYFPHYVKSDASAFHQWVFETLPTKLGTGTKLKISAPRGEAKSTLVTRLLCLWCVVTDRKHYMPIIMDAFDQAAQMLESIKVELDSNPRLLSDFPKATGQGRVWNAGVIVTANNIKIQAYGSGKRMRGATHGPYRPDLVFLDDIENDENVRSKEQRDKLDGWLKKVVLPLGPPDGSMDVIYLSTVLHYDSVANRTHRLPTWQSVKFKAIIQWPNRMDLWDKWEEFLVNLGPEAASDFYKGHKGQMDAGAIVSWPSQRPLVRLMSIRADDHRAFEHEYQNDPSNDDSAPFKQITFWVHQENDWVFYGACDPSLGKSNKSRDPSAILVGGWSRARGVLSVVESKIARMLPTLQIETIIALQREYKCVLWGVESVQFQEFFRTELIKTAAQRGIPVPARAILSATEKELRILSLQPYVTNAQIQLHQSQAVLVEQLRHWPESDHDDGPDALNMLWMLASTSTAGIPKIISGPRPYSNGFTGAHQYGNN